MRMYTFSSLRMLLTCKSLTCEHLQNSHPVLTCILTQLCNNTILSGYVPNSFGDGVIVPIPKGDKRNNNVVSDFRGITISNIVSKIFEHCLLIMTGKYLHSSERQFGFKKGVGCQHAIYSLRKIV